MTKTQKQRDKHIRQALTIACEHIKALHPGFAHLTHSIDLNNEQKMLKVDCYFKDEIAYHRSEADFVQLIDIISAQLSNINLPIKPKQISFSTL